MPHTSIAGYKDFFVTHAVGRSQAQCFEGRAAVCLQKHYLGRQLLMRVGRLISQKVAFRYVERYRNRIVPHFRTNPPALFGSL